MKKTGIIEKIIKNLFQSIKDTAKIVKQDAVYGARLGKAKLKEIKYEQKKLEKLIEIGRVTYSLYKKGLITDSQTKELCKQLSILESSAKTYHTLVEEYKKKIRISP